MPEKPVRWGRWAKIAGAVLFLTALFFLFSLWASGRRFDGTLLSDSMGGGPFLRQRCPECGGSFDLSAVVSSPSVLENLRFVGCPKCGFAEVPVDRRIQESAFRVPLSPPFQPPKRLDAAVFIMNGNDSGEIERGGKKSSALGVKRIIGLPGETVEIIQGDIWIDGEILHKQKEYGSAVLRQMEPVFSGDRIALVHQIPIPWLSEEKEKRLEPAKRAAPIQNTPEIPRIEPIPADRLENVRDFAVSFNWLLGGDSPGGPLTLLANQGDRFWRVVLSADKKNVNIEVYQTENKNKENDGDKEFLRLKKFDFLPSSRRGTAWSPGRKSARFPRDPDRTPKESAEIIPIRISFRDRSAAVEIDGKTVLSVQEEGEKQIWREWKNRPIAVPFAFPLPEKDTAEDSTESTPDKTTLEELLQDELGIESGSILVTRDLHYSTPESGRTVFEVPRGEFFLLGDNSAVSVDSREWKTPTVPRKKIKHLFPWR